LNRSSSSNFFSTFSFAAIRNSFICYWKKAFNHLTLIGGFLNSFWIVIWKNFLQLFCGCWTRKRRMENETNWRLATMNRNFSQFNDRNCELFFVNFRSFEGGIWCSISFLRVSVFLVSSNFIASILFYWCTREVWEFIFEWQQQPLQQLRSGNFKWCSTFGRFHDALIWLQLQGTTVIRACVRWLKLIPNLSTIKCH
jgi:hypothetical protein